MQNELKIFVACEESQVIAGAFREAGFNAYSCDIQECSGNYPGYHLRGDMFKYINDGWDLMIAHPPCTYLSLAGNRWFNETKYGDKARQRKQLRLEALEFFKKFAAAPIKHICIENPLGYANSHFRKPDQIIQPWQFGDEESKRTCLWLKNLPPLKPTKIVKPKIYGYFKTGPKEGKPIYKTQYCLYSDDRSKIRSKSFPGIANAMAEQWGQFILN